jgi:hypothetical protein
MNKTRPNKKHIVGGTIRGALASCLFVGAAILGLVGTNEAVGQTCTPPPPDMISWWPGDGNAIDIEGGNNGMLLGGVSFSAAEVG